jgi:hypothetical protein
MGFDSSSLDDYVDVAERIATFREKYPEGSLQPADLSNPYRIEVVGGSAFVTYVAAAYRTPDDARPGIGSAWEPVPGSTPYTRNSELQNAETAAWGRAIQAALAADARRGIASRQEVRNRRAERTAPAGEAAATTGLMARINALPTNAIKVACRKAVVAEFGQPGDIPAERLAEAEALVATFETGGGGGGGGKGGLGLAQPELASAGAKVNGNGRAA